MRGFLFSPHSLILEDGPKGQENAWQSALLVVGETCPLWKADFLWSLEVLPTTFRNTGIKLDSEVHGCSSVTLWWYMTAFRERPEARWSSPLMLTLPPFVENVLERRPCQIYGTRLVHEQE